MNTEKEIAKELHEITKNKPYLIDNSDIKGIDYIEVAKKFNMFFVFSDEAIFSWKMIDDFWALETKRQFSSDKLKIKNSVFFENAMKSFRMKYRIEKQYVDGPDIGLMPNTTGTRNYEINFEDVIKLPKHYVESNGYIIYNDKNAYVPLYYGIYKVLFFTEQKKLSMEELIHTVSTEDLPYSPDYDLPFEKKIILNEIKKYPKYFDYDVNFDNNATTVNPFDEDVTTVRLNNFLEPVVELFSEKRINYSEIMQYEDESGVIGIIFKGDEFPFKDGVEYAKIRDVIRIFTTDDFIKDASSFFNQTDIKTNTLNSIIDISLDLSNNADKIKELNQWLKENILLSFYPTEIEEAEFFRFCLGLKITPILETHPIFENIYRNNIIELNNAFIKKMGGENG